jgi:PTS system nitrogen regulatory IIA component
MRLADVLTVDGITTDLTTRDKEATLRELARLVAAGEGGSASEPGLDVETVYRALAEREQLATTGVGSGVAIPHGRLHTDRFRVAMAISPEGVPFDSVDGEPARILFAVLAPESHPADQLRVLARISRVLKDQAVRNRLLGAASRQDALDIVVEEELRH